ncbi:MAG: hypothetical protein JWO86_4906 [Myxococcaceae bacterium]|nr:hypothetical protein [Myxococcaceae bacterium]MEA2749615.1 hypothetical protein [Myxococcales bacterium]
MDSDGEPARESPLPVRPVRRRKLLPFLVLGAGALIAGYLSSKAPRDQHLRLVLGERAAEVTGLEIQYVAADGEVARDARMTFSLGEAPRIVSQEPQLADGDYRLRIDLDTREGRRSVERRVTLGGGTTQVDVSR